MKCLIHIKEKEYQALLMAAVINNFFCTALYPKSKKSKGQGGNVLVWKKNAKKKQWLQYGTRKWSRADWNCWTSIKKCYYSAKISYAYNTPHVSGNFHRQWKWIAILLWVQNNTFNTCCDYLKMCSTQKLHFGNGKRNHPMLLWTFNCIFIQLFISLSV